MSTRFRIITMGRSTFKLPHLKKATIDTSFRNAGLFLWLDLSAHLPLQQSGCDGWAAQDILARRFEQAGVIMSNGSSYRAPKPGYFRVVHSLPKETLRKGIERYVLVM